MAGPLYLEAKVGTQALSARKETQMRLHMEIRISAAVAGVVDLLAWCQVRRRLVRGRTRLDGNRRLATAAGTSREACGKDRRQGRFLQ
ncbi:hypothetical protein [Paraburkholderia sp. BL6669N2]|uniref:hypothetical protein n=1 Tax=Paraburkholderia sp. BL6669N2 TaxID=1938807 RepID=UPI0015F27958|nr:hypothetical protein [Paraburkholderia sp. BL6669N2]